MKNLMNIFKINFLILIAIFTLFSFSKIEASEPTFDWAKQLVGQTGGTNWPSQPNSITKDSSGNIYLTGQFEGTVDFDPGTGVANLTSVGDYDVYILKLNSNGEYLWAKSVGGTSYEGGYSLSLDSNANVYVTGEFNNTVDFDPSEATANLTSAGNSDIYILKLNSNGEYIYAKSIGGTGVDWGSSLSFDSNANVYVTGGFQNTVDFNPGTEVVGDTLTSSGSYDTYILKLNSNGEYLWAKSVGGTGDDSGSSLSLDSNGNIYVTGWFHNIVDFDSGTEVINLTAVGGDTYILKLNSNGEYIWAKSVGGTGYDSGYSLYLDDSNNVYITGGFQNTVDFDPGTEVVGDTLTSSGSYDTYILKLNSNGEYLWAKSVGGTGDDSGSSLSLDSNGNIYVTGWFHNIVDFDSGEAIVNLTPAGSYGSFILKLNSNGEYLWVGAVLGPDKSYPYSIYIDSDNSIYLAGEIYGIADMDPGTGTYTLDASVSGDDSFILKLTQTKPIITLTGESNITIYKGETYTDGGATANDITYGDLTGSIVTVNNVNTEETGEYTITYNLTDQSGNKATEVTRRVTVNNRPVSSGSSASLRYTNLLAMGNTQLAEEVKKEFPNQITPILTPVTTPTSSPTELITSISNITKTLKPTTKKTILSEVKDLQSYLALKGYDCGKHDGIFGKKTKTAVILFQKANGLTPDGIVGPKTREKMK